ncbi:hypothetical protein AB0O01_26315 [Streptomyces sp. NPDC093252]|uniref:hypothetical protein n=1 Tax=Streptomyces sp. NPDC093252 TaxID=3154980 RepID=UPI003412C94C
MPPVPVPLAVGPEDPGDPGDPSDPGDPGGPKAPAVPAAPGGPCTCPGGRTDRQDGFEDGPGDGLDDGSGGDGSNGDPGDPDAPGAPDAPDAPGTPGAPEDAFGDDSGDDSDSAAVMARSLCVEATLAGCPEPERGSPRPGGHAPSMRETV